MIRTKTLFVAFATLALVACASQLGTTSLPSDVAKVTRRPMSTTPSPSPPPGMGPCTTPPGTPPGTNTWVCWTGGTPTGLPTPCLSHSDATCMDLLGGANYIDPVTGGTDYLNPNIPASGPGVPGSTYRNMVFCVKQRVISDLQGAASYNITPGSDLASINSVAINTSVPEAANDDMADGLGELLGANQPYEAVYLLQEYGASNFSATTQQEEGDLLGVAIDTEDHACSP